MFPYSVCVQVKNFVSLPFGSPVLVLELVQK